jgi:cysteine desulfurase
MKRIYLDNAATTPLDKRVAKAMADFELEYWGNPNSIHREGQKARAKIDFARADIAKFLNARPQEIVFTSGATEANNLAIKGIISWAIFNLRIKPHIITTEIEHQSVYNVVKEMESRGVVDATYIKPSKEGLIDPADVIKEIRDETVLISAIFVSNEIGSILPIREIGKLLAEYNSREKHKIYFHSDAVQAVKYLNCNIEKLGVDLLTISAHKIHGPKGIGALYIKSGTKIDPTSSGGSQEYGLRPGTQNTSGIIGMAKAYEMLGSLELRQKNAEKISKLRDKLIAELSKIENVEINGPMGEYRSPDNVNFNVYGVDQEALMAALDLAGIAASTGSACVSGSAQPSHVIKAIGRATDWASATVRLTLSNQTTSSETAQVIKTLPQILNKLK